MTLELFWISGSPYAWRVQLALHHQRIPHVSHRIDSSSGDHRKPPFLKMNPHGRIPVMKDGDFVLYESVAILGYLDEVHSDRSLFGTEPQVSALVRQRISEFEHYNAEVFSTQVVRPVFAGKLKEDPAAVVAGAERAIRSLGWMEEVLAASDYLAGDRISAADFVALPNLQMLLRAGRRPEAIEAGLGLSDLQSSHPAIAAWNARLEALPAFDASYPPHWRR